MYLSLSDKFKMNFIFLQIFRIYIKIIKSPTWKSGNPLIIPNAPGAHIFIILAGHIIKVIKNELRS
jgi:hypothetical protein